MSSNLTAVLQELLQNTSNLKVLRQLMTPDATYVSLNFDNPELKRIMPWAGTHKGPQEIPVVFTAIQSFWKTLDFKVTDTVAYVQFLEDSYGTAGSFKTGGATRFHSDPSGKEVEV